MSFLDVLKGYDYKNLKSLVVDDQTQVEKMKKRKRVKESSKTEKKVVKSAEEQKEVDRAEVEIVNLDRPEVVGSVASLNNDWFNSNKLNSRNHGNFFFFFFSHCYSFHGN